ncbi:hypothetical protein ACFQV2_22400 [Actinokineospora soli]|uniref:HTH araC/xylS-type domain-containing protein n=1 Tax=Actinokineospora soli TaxID=1048753 RepID=A0ABW2TPV4_9PSEU
MARWRAGRSSSPAGKSPGWTDSSTPTRTRRCPAASSPTRPSTTPTRSRCPGASPRSARSPRASTSSRCPATSHPTPVTGLRDTPRTLTDPAGRSCAITIALTPDGAHALFGVPLREIANRTVSWTDLLGRRGATIPDQLAEARDWRTRFRVLDHHLVTLMRPRTLTPQVRGAWHRLTTTAGAIRIDTLADELGWTRQHLHTRFRDQIGLTPKTVARLARLGRATTLMSRPEPRPWPKSPRCAATPTSPTSTATSAP